MFNKNLDAINIKNNTIDINCFSLKYCYLQSNNKPFYYINTRFKYNFKYYITFMMGNLSAFFFNYRTNVSCDLNQLKKKERYTAQQYILINFVDILLEDIDFNFFFFYKNIAFTHLLFLKDFFKLIRNIGLSEKLKEIVIAINMGMSRSLSKYFKKVKTRKKFKKKMFFKEFLFKYKKVFF
jgi:hypothetical protein